jgi:glycerol kinase
MLIGIDQGTTGTTCIAFDLNLRPVAQTYRPLTSRHPHPGWVEQDPEEIVATVVEGVGELLARIGGPAGVQAVGLDNQGESVLAWDAQTGRALTPVLVWSDRRALDIVTRLRGQGHAPRVQELTGLELNDYFAAAKMAWLLERSPAVQEARTRKRLQFGTLDTWLALRLGGQAAVTTDQSTASRTQLLGLASGGWEPELFAMFGIPAESLPIVRPSLGDWGTLSHPSWNGALPWRASLVDQPAALAGNACFRPGEMKVSYGTGCFLLANAGSSPPRPGNGLLASIAWSRADTRTYALDGGVFTAGTAIEWLVGLGIVSSAAETAGLAEAAGDSGVRFLPAFTGLGAPWWDGEARGVFSGLTAGTTRGDLVRAVLDSIAFRVRDIAEALWASGQPRPSALKVDGGLSKNRYLMQRQADLLGIPIEIGATAEATACGSATLAAIAADLLTEDAARASFTVAHRFEPQISADRREHDYARWKNWIARARELGEDSTRSGD